MASHSPRLNPQPEPPLYEILLVNPASDSGKDVRSVDIVTGAGVIEVNFKKRRVTVKYPEKGDPGKVPAARALTAALRTWRETADGKGLKELHAHAEGMLLTAVEALLAVRTAK